MSWMLSEQEIPHGVSPETGANKNTLTPAPVPGSQGTPGSARNSCKREREKERMLSIYPSIHPSIHWELRAFRTPVILFLSILETCWGLTFASEGVWEKQLTTTLSGGPPIFCSSGRRDSISRSSLVLQWCDPGPGVFASRSCARFHHRHSQNGKPSMISIKIDRFTQILSYQRRPGEVGSILTRISPVTMSSTMSTMSHHTYIVRANSTAAMMVDDLAFVIADDKKEKKKKPKKKEEAAEPAPAPEPAPPPPAEEPKKASTRGSRKQAKRTGSNVFSMFSQKQVAEFKEGFQLMDADKDGILGKSDLRSAHDIVGRMCSEKELDEMLSDAPGPINFTTLLTMFGERMSGGSDDDDVVIAAFKSFDEGDGNIDSEK
ncbi:unnamed protein product [Notodromas monacha]|uniref:EF-hand domain-containing protein n=1 Tax=Notodromas monacha TaxID=399045 RepID=A0A7R9GHG3_9CRUS|nr:unnamed protein product [Notodromas monacha]CAG0922763.1 unnamed protein product [Notodromas monacha]